MSFSHYRALLLLTLSFWAHQPALAQPPAVVASIKPIHSLVAAVMADLGEPALIIEGGGSPHHYVLSPAKARIIARADLLFWVDPQLESVLTKPIANLATQAKVVTLSQLPELQLLPSRTEQFFDGGEHHLGHHHASAQDLHLWLDPHNAQVMVGAISAALSAADPANAPRYRQNAAEVTAQLGELARELERRLQSVTKRPFMVFHDGYQYFEHRFGLNAVGAITLNPELAPSARRVAAVRAQMAADGVVCLFTEPQFTPKIVSVVAEGGAAKIGQLDPLGAELADGPTLYFRLLRQLADGFATCLDP